MKTGAAIGGLLILGAGVAGWVSTQRAHEAHIQRAPSPTIQHEPERIESAESMPWEWVGRTGWPALNAVNVECRQVNHCRDFPGAQRARCFEEGIPRCEVAVSALQRTVYRLNLQAHRDFPEVMDRLQPPTSSEEALGDLVERRTGPRFREIEAAMSACFAIGTEAPPAGQHVGATDAYLRAHLCAMVLHGGARCDHGGGRERTAPTGSRLPLMLAPSRRRNDHRGNGHSWRRTTMD